LHETTFTKSGAIHHNSSHSHVGQVPDLPGKTAQIWSIKNTNLLAFKQKL